MRRMLKVKTSDGKVFSLTETQLGHCKTFKDMLEDASSVEEAIDVPSIHSEHLQFLLDLLEPPAFRDNLPEEPLMAVQVVSSIETKQIPMYWQCLTYASFLNSAYLIHYIKATLAKTLHEMITAAGENKTELREKVWELFSIPESRRVGATVQPKEKEEQEAKKIKV